MPRARQPRMTRRAISPRLAIRTLCSTELRRADAAEAETASSTATRQSEPVGTQRSRSVTPPWAPSRRSFTRRCSPRRAHATIECRLPCAPRSRASRSGPSSTSGASQRRVAATSPAISASPKAASAWASAGAIGHVPVDCSRRMNSAASSLSARGRRRGRAHAADRARPGHAARRLEQRPRAAPRRRGRARPAPGVRRRCRRTVSPAATWRRSSSMQRARMRHVGGS